MSHPLGSSTYRRASLVPCLRLLPRPKTSPAHNLPFPRRPACFLPHLVWRRGAATLHTGHQCRRNRTSRTGWSFPRWSWTRRRRHKQQRQVTRTLLRSHTTLGAPTLCGDVAGHRGCLIARCFSAVVRRLACRCLWGCALTCSRCVAGCRTAVRIRKLSGRATLTEQWNNMVHTNEPQAVEAMDSELAMAIQSECVVALQAPPLRRRPAHRLLTLAVLYVWPAAAMFLATSTSRTHSCQRMCMLTCCWGYLMRSMQHPPVLQPRTLSSKRVLPT